MPEGPEVNVIKDGLNYHLKGKIVTDIDLPEGSKFLKKTPDGYNAFKSSLPLKCLEVKSKGKLIYFVFENGWYLMCRLLMSGGWYLEKAPKHNHCQITYQPSNSIWFIDPRHFGTLKWTNEKQILETVLSDIGPDLLNEHITEKEYLEVMKNKKNGKRKISSVMMDQSIFSGIGNYLKSEILYQAKVAPDSVVNNIPDDIMKEILKITIQKIKLSYKAGGASIRDYSDIRGKEGEYSFTFSVYQKKKDPNGYKIIAEKTKDGRTSHWVPEVQIVY